MYCILYQYSTVYQYCILYHPTVVGIAAPKDEEEDRVSRVALYCTRRPKRRSNFSHQLFGCLHVSIFWKFRVRTDIMLLF